jgi:hypothetical protein
LIIVSTIKLGDVGIYFIATFVKNQYSTIPMNMNTTEFSIMICHIPVFFPQSNFRVITIDKIAHNSRRIMKTDVNLMSRFFSDEYDKGAEYMFCNWENTGLSLFIVGRTSFRFLSKIPVTLFSRFDPISS